MLQSFGVPKENVAKHANLGNLQHDQAKIARSTPFLRPVAGRDTRSRNNCGNLSTVACAGDREDEVRVDIVLGAGGYRSILLG